ncbi:MAG: prenyltransferase/squalene oxidase repeat-containing protein, partial [Lentisphaerota bacterium]
MNIDVKKVYRLFVQHVWGPTGSVLLHIVVVIALLRMVTYKAQEKAPEVEVVIMEPDATDLEEFDKELEKLEDLPEVVDNITPPDVNIEMEAPPEVDNFAAAEPDVDFAALDVSSEVQSPLVMKGLFQGRSSGGRSAALKNYGGQWGQFTEAAVVKALAWLKRNQNPDGSWGPSKTAMTGLGLLTFLAHGETTASEEYGQTVEKAIRFLVSQQDPEGRFCKIDQPGSYAHAIGTYAISEAYGLTRIPSLKPVMEKAIQVIMNGQQPKGGWDY